MSNPAAQEGVGTHSDATSNLYTSVELCSVNTADKYVSVPAMSISLFFSLLNHRVLFYLTGCFLLRLLCLFGFEKKKKTENFTERIIERLILFFILA